jgi:hypothetical protein
MKAALFFILLSVTVSAAQPAKRDSIWTPVNFFVGTWAGEGSGEPGIGKYERSYKPILNGNFVEIHNKSSYPPTDKHPNGEVHEDVGYIIYDKARKTFLLRQLHAEGFANDYVLESISPDKKTLVYTSESIINIPKGWRARETYRILNDTEFEETFELSPPDKPYAVYSKVKFSRRP